jgi:hypothetical protein
MNTGAKGNEMEKRVKNPAVAKAPKATKRFRSEIFLSSSKSYDNMMKKELKQTKITAFEAS